jgi:hypothetical protein
MEEKQEKNTIVRQPTGKNGTVGPWHLIIALIGVGSIVFLVGFVFEDRFTTAGDVIAVISYIAAISGAIFGVQIAVRGAKASAENNVNKETAASITKEIGPLEDDISELAGFIRKASDSPIGTSMYILDTIDKQSKRNSISIPPEKIENIRIRLSNIRSGLNHISK